VWTLIALVSDTLVRASVNAMRTWLAGLFLFAGCSTTFDPKPCAVDGDCGTGLVCEQRDEKPVCVHSEDAPLVIGTSAPLTGTNQALGTAMKLGIQLAFDEQNAKGGIRGRQLVMDFRDDGYDPNLAEQNARALTDVDVLTTPPICPSTSAMIAGNPPVSTTGMQRGPAAVLAFLGNIGTPTLLRAGPIAVETNTLFFGAFTGSSTILRDTTCGDCVKYIFNVRASYAQEARATMELFHKRGVADYQHLISFDQNDSYGDAGFKGMLAAYTAVIDPANTAPNIARFRYTRNDDTSVPAQAAAAEAYLAQVLTTDQSSTVNVGVMMTDTYGAGATFIQALRTWQFANDSQQTSLMKAARLKLYFSNVSFVGPNSLADRLKSAGTVNTPSGPMAYTQDVTVSQVVPNYESDSSDVVTAYNKLVATAGATPGFTSLEGYIDARVFIAGLIAHDGPFTPKALVDTFEALPDLSLGIGATSGFSPTNHQYSNSVWGTSIQSDGTFKNLYFWTNGSPIQFFE
jgi:branched-chain amino acid transport system substrate-binding protein